MITRLVLRLPWFIATPTVLAMALLAVVLFAVIANPYFKRTFTDDALPAGFDVGSAAVAAPATAPPPGATVVAPAAASGAVAVSTPTANAVASAVATPRPPPSPAATVAATTGPVLLLAGAFIDGDPGHTGRGQARVIRGADGSHLLRLEDFSVTNGPDLFVVLSTDPKGSRASAADPSARNLGALKATDGNLNYPIPAGIDVTAYQSVIIYCRAFRVVFAIATLHPAQ